MFGLLADCFILLVGVAYPAYESFKSIKYRNVNGYVRWMCYWVVYAAYTLCEATIGRYLLFWLPFYDFLRCLCVVWLVAPFTRGAQLLYKHLVHPELSKHEAQIDAICDAYRDALHQGATGLVRYAATALFQSVLKLNALVFNFAQSRSSADQRDVTPLQLRFRNTPPVTYLTSGQGAWTTHDPASLGVSYYAMLPNAEPPDSTRGGARLSSFSSEFADGLEFGPSSQLTSTSASANALEPSSREAIKPPSLAQSPPAGQPRPSAANNSSSSSSSNAKATGSRTGTDGKSPSSSDSTSTSHKKATFGAAPKGSR